MFNSIVVREWLDQNERSAAWLARKAGVAKLTMLRALDGSHSPTLSTVAAIAKVTGLEPNDLLRTEQAPAPSPTQPESEKTKRGAA